MKTRFAALFAACAATNVVCGDVAPLAVTESACAFAVDSTLDSFAVKSGAEQADLASRFVTRRTGESVTLTAPDGTVSNLVESSSTATSAAFPLLDAGGTWTLSNSRQGTVTFTVRRSLDGSLGGGTAGSPARLVDGDELVDYGAGAGYTFTPDASGLLLSEIKLPDGFAMEKVSDGVWRLVSSLDGSLYTWAQIEYRADARGEGPNRRSRSDTVPPVAYSGDNWIGDMSKAATLTFVSPDGTETVLNRIGSGAESFTFDKTGHWTITLRMADGSTRTAELLLRDQFMINFR